MASVDNIWAVVTFFGLAIFFMGLMIGWNVLSSEATDLWEGSSKGVEIKNNAQNFVNQFDWIILMVWVSIHIGILVTAFLLRTHPVMYIVSIFLVVILAVIAAPLSNAYDDLTDDGELSTAINDLPKTHFVMNNLPKLEVVWAFITVIVMFGLARYEGFV